VHTHAIADVTNLQTALDGKAAASHGHAIADVTNLQTALDGKAAASHGHAIADVTNLQTSLDAKLNAAGHATNKNVTTDGSGAIVFTDPPAAVVGVVYTQSVAGSSTTTHFIAATGTYLITFDASWTKTTGAGSYTVDVINALNTRKFYNPVIASGDDTGLSGAFTATLTVGDAVSAAIVANQGTAGLSGQNISISIIRLV